jgi:hypothetical protein
MGVQTGDKIVIEVETTDGGGVYVPVNDMNRFSRRNTRGATRTRVFMRARPYLTRGQRETTATISGLLNTTDTGQGLLRTAMNTDVPIRLRILPDGTNGFIQQFYVNNTGNDATPDPADMQDASFELSDAADPVVVGTGPVL